MHADLWSFAVALYARPGVEAACLAVQEHGADVCLLLCAAWLEQRRVTPSDERAEQLGAMAKPWQREVVQPLRALRQQWRTPAAADSQLAALREQIKMLELNAERLQLERLQGIAEGWTERDEATAENWLERLAPASIHHHGALQVLRAAAMTTQDAVDGD